MIQCARSADFYRQEGSALHQRESKMAENDSNPSETSVEQVEVRKQKLAKPVSYTHLTLPTIYSV